MPFRPRAATVVLVGALVVILGATATPSAGLARKPTSPGSPSGDDVTRLLDVPFADPGFYVEGQSRYIYATGFDPEGWTAFRVSRYDAETGTYGTPVPSMVERPEWVGPRGSRHARGEVHMWGPHVWKRSVPGPRDYVMYFSASRRGGTDCLGMAIAESPMGPFDPRARPLRCGTKGSTLIDPAYFDTPGGPSYLIYKRHRYDTKAIGIWAVRVHGSGEPVRGARPFRLVDGGGKQVEAPSVVTRHGRTYLFASRRAYNSCAYRTVVYVGAVHREFRWLGNVGLRRPGGRRFCGPGGAEVRNVSGVFRMVFHAFDANPRFAPEADRYAWGVPLRWTSTGKPYAAPAPPASRFERVPRATVSKRTKSGSSSFSPYRSRS